MNWIKCSNQMPPYEKSILGVTDEYKYYGLMLCRIKDNDYWIQLGNGFSLDQKSLRVTNWMPLPKFPEEK